MKTKFFWEIFRESKESEFRVFWKILLRGILFFVVNIFWSFILMDVIWDFWNFFKIVLIALLLYGVAFSKLSSMEPIPSIPAMASFLISLLSNSIRKIQKRILVFHSLIHDLILVYRELIVQYELTLRPKFIFSFFFLFNH